MAANPKVEKLQALALRHGEKAVVTVAVVLFLFFVFKAITREAPIAFGPDALQKKAEAADSNLSKKQEPSQILETLVASGLKPQTDFEKVVVQQQAHALNPADFVVKQKWVTPEPGAGLIRDQPELSAPENLYAYPNRGGYQLFETDEKGERIVDNGKDARKRRSGITPPRRRRGMMGGMGGGSGMSMMGSRPGGGSGGSAKAKAEAEARAKEEEARLRRSVAGDTKEAGKSLTKDETKDAAAQPEANVVYKEVVKGLRSVVITGTLDNKQLKANYLAALKDPNLAYPNYKRLDVQRQVLGPDGQWSDFADVDADANLKVLDNLTEVDDELVPKDVLLEALVDPLPFPKAGYWTGVHVASLIPKEKLEVKRPTNAPGMYGGGSSMGSSMEMMAGAGRGGSGPMMGSSSSMMEGSRGGSGMMGSSGGMMGPGMPGSGGMMGVGAGNPAGPADETDFPKSEADEVMIRSIDFTVEPDMTYRYRVRIVVVNPNRYRTDVNPGVETEADELKGDWSEPTDDVSVPADVAAYAMKKAAPTRRNDQVVFQLVRWNPADGHTVTRNDEAGPGELIGQQAVAQVPSSEGKGTTSTPIDFNSRRIVLDTMGGLMPAPKVIGASAPFEEPAISLVLRPDGAVAIRSQPLDVADPVRDEMDRNYQRALKDSTKKRAPRGMGSMSMGSGTR